MLRMLQGVMGDVKFIKGIQVRTLTSTVFTQVLYVSHSIAQLTRISSICHNYYDI